MTDDQSSTAATSWWVVIDVGCHECGVGSEPVGIFATKGEANEAANARDIETKRWRDGGQTFCLVFEMPPPKGSSSAGVPS